MPKVLRRLITWGVPLAIVVVTINLVFREALGVIVGVAGCWFVVTLRESVHSSDERP